MGENQLPDPLIGIALKGSATNREGKSRVKTKFGGKIPITEAERIFI